MLLQLRAAITAIVIILYLSSVLCDTIPGNGYKKYGPYTGMWIMGASSYYGFLVTVDNCDNPNLRSVIGDGCVYTATRQFNNECVFIQNNYIWSIDVTIGFTATEFVIIQKQQIEQKDNLINQQKQQIQALIGENQELTDEIHVLKIDKIKLGEQILQSEYIITQLNLTTHQLEDTNNMLIVEGKAKTTLAIILGSTISTFTLAVGFFIGIVIAMAVKKQMDVGAFIPLSL